MKLLLIFLFSLMLLAKADSSHLKFQADQAYTDGFYALASTYYLQSFASAEQKEQLLLIPRLCKTAEKTTHYKETLTLINTFLKQRSTRELDVVSLSNVYLHKALLELIAKEWLAADSSCQVILKNIKKLPEEMLQKTLDTAVFALVNAKKLQAASDLIGTHHKSFKDNASIQFQNARLKILLGQYITAIAILEKYKESSLATPHFLALWAYQKAGSTDKAIDVYKNKLSTFKSADDPVFGDVLIKLAEKAYSKHAATCLEMIDKAYAIETNNEKKANIILKKAELLINSKDPLAVDVLKSYLSLYKNSPQTAAVNKQLAELIQEKKEGLLESEAYSTQAINNSTGELLYKSLLIRASIRFKLNKLSEAADDMNTASETALKLKMDNAKVTVPLFRAGSIEYTRGLASEKKDHFIKAANYFEKSISLNSTFAKKAWLMQAQALRKAGQSLKASQALNSMEKAFTNQPDAIFLKGIALLEARQAFKGIDSLRRFINLAPTDPRVATAYVEAIRAAIYLPGNQDIAQFLIEQFKALKQKNKENQSLLTATPVVLHLEALMHWQNNHKFKARKAWKNFLKIYPAHSFNIEVRLWLAFDQSLQNLPNLATQHYEDVLAQSKSSSLRGYTLLQYSKNRFSLGKYRDALQLLKDSEDYYRNLKEPSTNNSHLAAVLFFTGDVNCKMGFYAKAEKYFSEAAILSTDNALKLAMKGRSGDCFFSLASQLKKADDNKDYLATINKAKDCFEEIYKSNNADAVIKEQALYKLAKCWEAIGLTNEKDLSANSALAKACTYLDKLFSDAQDGLKKGTKTDSYYFSRAGYDLARLHLSFNDPNYSSAINIYTILGRSGYAGTQEARALAKEILAVKNKEDQ